MSETNLRIMNGTIDLLHPQPSQIDFEVVAHVLSRTGRFCNHPKRFYSVAEHCCHGAEKIINARWSDVATRKLAAAAFLLHDAHEAYLGDITRPMRRALTASATGSDIYIREAFDTLTNRFDRAIYTAAGFEWPLPPTIQKAVRWYDDRLLSFEYNILFELKEDLPGHDPWLNEGFDLELAFLNFDKAKDAWIHWAKYLLPALKEKTPEP